MVNVIAEVTGNLEGASIDDIKNMADVLTSVTSVQEELTEESMVGNQAIDPFVDRSKPNL